MASSKKLRCKIGGKVHGPVDVSELRKIPGFTLSTLVAPPDEETWQSAHKAIDLGDYFGNQSSVPNQDLDMGLQEAWVALARGSNLTHARPAYEFPGRPVTSDSESRSKFGPVRRVIETLVKAPIRSPGGVRWVFRFLMSFAVLAAIGITVYHRFQAESIYFTPLPAAPQSLQQTPKKMTVEPKALAPVKSSAVQKNKKLSKRQ